MTSPKKRKSKRDSNLTTVNDIKVNDDEFDTKFVRKTKFRILATPATPATPATATPTKL